jgi:hypothetical protein
LTSRIEIPILSLPGPNELMSTHTTVLAAGILPGNTCVGSPILHVPVTKGESR